MSETVGSRLGLIGDAHSNTDFLIDAASALVEAGCDQLVSVGDFGLVWDGSSGERRKLRRLDAALEIMDRVLWVVDGNHENHSRVAALPIDSAGFRWAGERIAFLPRGHRATTPGGRVVAFLGGACSVDRRSRVPGRTWWPAEAIGEDDLERLGTEPADVLIGHDSPQSVALTDRLAGERGDWDPGDLAYAEAGQASFHKAFLTLHPRVAVGGHYHRHLDVVERFVADGTVFESRVIVLDMERQHGSAAVLDMDGGYRFTIVDASGSRIVSDAGAEFAELRRRTGLAPEQLAPRLGIGVTAVLAVLDGRVRPSSPLMDRLRALVDDVEKNEE